MRGGQAAAARARRKQMRMRPADRLAEGATDAQVTAEFQVSRTSTNRWHRRWPREALIPKGPGGEKCQRTQIQPEAALQHGPAAYSRDEDQRWTLVRIAALI